MNTVTVLITFATRRLVNKTRTGKATDVDSSTMVAIKALKMVTVARAIAPTQIKAVKVVFRYVVALELELFSHSQSTSIRS